MTDQPQTWHYGLMARWWAEFVVEGGDDLAYFQRAVARHGQPALDLACGTGRLLIPLRQAGWDVDGCDISPDMIALCRERADRAGVAPALYVQAMHEIALPRAYQTIYMCGAFGIGGRREHDREALRRCYHHLAPGGTLVFDHHLPYEEATEWGYWLPEERALLPVPWPQAGERRRAANGEELEQQFRLVALDPLAQRQTMQVRCLLWRAGELRMQEEHTIQLSPYFCQEVLLLLELAGFRDVTVYGYGRRSEVPATPDDRVIVFVARKAS